MTWWRAQTKSAGVARCLGGEYRERSPAPTLLRHTVRGPTLHSPFLNAITHVPLFALEPRVLLHAPRRGPHDRTRARGRSS
jgi:hypothetical protein